MRHIAVIGLGRFGSTVARELTDRGAHVIAIDAHKQRVDDIKESVTYAVVADATDEQALRGIGVQNVDVAVVCVGENIEANLLTTLLLKRMGIKKVWARAISPLQQEILKTMDVDNIINLEEEMGAIVANSLISPAISKAIPLTADHIIIEMKVPRSLVGKTLREIKLRELFKINLIAVKQKKPAINDQGDRVFEEMLVHVPSPDEPLKEEDILLVIGGNDDIQKFAK
ncbi:MAG TPA: TrkA family potassium uptake protein [Candidatus Omnitrophota bacterium]|nr:TrkA family potassium uptake protein [Candidatus Omnitrophota bacterium]